MSAQPAAAERFPLTPVIHPQLRAMLAQPALIESLVAAFHSPLNLIFPERAAAAGRRFAAVFKELGVSGSVYMAHKPTKSDAVLKEISVTEFGVDVASLDELRHALSCGVPACRLEATGPKNADFLALAVQHGVTINADTMQEVETARALHQALGLANKLELLVRFNGLAGQSAADTQFGTPIGELNELLTYFKSNSRTLSLRGFSFHLSAPNRSDRLSAIAKTIGAVLEAQQRGFNADVIDIGGGFRVNFLESAAEWSEYLSALKRSAMEGGRAFGWNRTALGYRKQAGLLSGAPIFHDHYVEEPGASELRSLLLSAIPGFDGKRLSSVLEELMLSLWIEPGRSMLDQAGITIGRVVGVKRSSHGEQIVLLDLNRTNLNSVDLEPMADPILLSQSAAPPERWQGFLAGNLCLYSDIVLRHRVHFDVRPAAGDLIAFVNTAGYNMDFAEARPLMQKTAARIAVRGGEGDAPLEWFTDEAYKPAQLARTGRGAW